MRKVIGNAYDAAIELEQTRNYYPRSTKAVKDMAKQVGIGVEARKVPATQETAPDRWQAPGIARIRLEHNGVDLAPWSRVISDTGYSYEQAVPKDGISITVPATFLHPEAIDRLFLRLGCEGYTQSEHKIEFDLSPDLKARKTTVELERVPEGHDVRDARTLLIMIETQVHPLGGD